jgi:hypothetical protein
MIIWLLGLHLSVQSVPITTNVVSSNSDRGKLYSIVHYVIKFVSAILKHNTVWLRINAVEIFCGNKNKYIIEGLSWNLNLYDHESMLPNPY